MTAFLLVVLMFGGTRSATSPATALTVVSPTPTLGLSTDGAVTLRPGADGALPVACVAALVAVATICTISARRNTKVNR